MTPPQWNSCTKTVPRSVPWHIRLLKLITSWLVLWTMTAWLSLSLMTLFALLLKSIQKAQLPVLRESGGNTTERMLFGIATHANISIPWKLLMILSGVLRQLDLMAQLKLLAGHMITAMTYSLKLIQNISVRSGNFPIPKKENKLIFTTNIWDLFTTKPGSFWKQLIDMFSWLIAHICPGGLTLAVLSGSDLT